MIYNLQLCLHPRKISGSIPAEVAEEMEKAKMSIKQRIVELAEEDLYNLKGKLSI